MKTPYSLPCLVLITVFVCGLTYANDVDITSGASSAHPADSMPHQFGNGGDAFEKFGDELGLSGQQRTDIQIIIADYIPRYRDLAKLGRDTAAGLLSLDPTSSEYLDATQKASATAASSAAELVTLLSEMRAKLYAVLTAEQRQTFRDLIAARHSHAADEAPAP